MNRLMLPLFIAPGAILAVWLVHFYSDAEAWVPGLIFGFFSIYPLREYLKTALRKIVWVSVSTVAYVFAYSFTWMAFFMDVAKHNPRSTPEVGMPLFIFVLGGMLGALVLGFGARFLVNQISTKSLLLLVLAGGFFSISVLLGDPVSSLEPFATGGAMGEGLPKGVSSLVFVWQIGVAFVLGWIVDKAQQ